MPNNKSFIYDSVVDFVRDPVFQEWVISPDDKEVANFWESFLATYPEKREAANQAKTVLQSLVFKESWPESVKLEQALNKALEEIDKDRNTSTSLTNSPKNRYSGWIGWAAAAVLLFSVIGWWFFTHTELRTDLVTKNAAPAVGTIMPGGNKAILTLDDGSKILLDSVGKGAITTEGNVEVVKTGEGHLFYKNDGSVAEERFNTVSTPRGGQYQLTLSDGSKVWLNAASSLKYPTVFLGNERKVELTGEGYFEVAPNDQQPFLVKINDVQVKVLGTHFNINGYSEEAATATTVVSGQVKVTRNENELLLGPGQQAIASVGVDALQKRNRVDTEAVIAWKNGRFVFNSVHLDVILQQVARWYDVEIVYEGRTDETFSGALPRSENVTKLLNILDATGKVGFKINGKQIIVKAKK